MDQRLFIILCLAGVHLVSSVPRKYYLILQAKTWTEAQTYCRTKHTDLATLENDADMIRIQTEAQNHQFSSSAWIGLYNDINSWRWSYNNETLGTMRLWKPFQPDNLYGNEECVAISPTGWLDLACTVTGNSLCFDERQTGTNRYIYYNEDRTWIDAQTFCRQQHTDLASCRDSTENSLILSMLPGPGWFGLHRDSWKWSDQTSFPNAKLMPVKARGKDCVSVNNGLTAGASCSDIKPFYCYGVITAKQQILRLKVHSDQDLNNPAVKSAILDQIKEPMNAQRLENTTLKFREEPDGKVFHMVEGRNNNANTPTGNQEEICLRTNDPEM